MENKDFKVVFSELKTEDIEKYIQLANQELAQRKKNRAKELWDIVMAAIKKYEEETGDSILFITDRDEYTIEYMNNMGEITLTTLY